MLPTRSVRVPRWALGGRRQCPLVLLPKGPSDCSRITWQTPSEPIRNSSTARAHWRPSRIAQTTSDWPRRMSPAAKTFGSRGGVAAGAVGCWPWRCRAHPSARRTRRACDCSGETKPIASSTRSAGISNSEPGTSCMACRPSTPGAPAFSALTLPFSPIEALGGDRPVAVGAFLVRGRGAQTRRPVGPHRVAGRGRAASAAARTA